jgi:carbamoyltransferase
MTESAPTVLGVSALFHDSAAALLVDGTLVAAAEEERFSRRKHDGRFPDRAIAYCLAQARELGTRVDYVAYFERPGVKLQRALATVLAGVPHTAEPFGQLVRRAATERTVRERLAASAGVPPDRVLFVDHHVSHAASAFFTSPFESAATLTVDGVGEWTTTSIGRGSDGTSLALCDTMAFPHSLGLLYSAFTEYLGFEVNDGEYKVMGLAAFGQPRYLEAVERVATLYADGSLWLDMSYFRFHRSTRSGFSPRLADLLGGPPRQRGGGWDLTETAALDAESRRYADIAASLQAFTERAMVTMAGQALRRTGERRLCLAGGVALNGVANARILAESGAEEIFIPPAPGDSGGALGAALYAHHVLLGRPRAPRLCHAYWGAEHSQGQIVDALDRSGHRYHRVADPEELTAEVAGHLAAGRVVGWFQGRFEFGPRALGNRSILADPRSAEMKDIVNRKIKFREPFRPFAPAMLTETAGDYVVGGGDRAHPARFMLLVLPLREDFAAAAPAVDHFGTGRVQTVDAATNPLFHSLIDRFRAETGLGCVLNTSFNVRGEPIVSTPGDALATFDKTDLDVLVMEDHVVLSNR